MTALTLVLFGLVYLGMILGGWPGLALDRTGIALLGAIALIGSGELGVDEAARAIDLPTLILLFAFMVVSAQMRLAGFYDALTRRLAALPLSPAQLLGALVVVAGALSAVFSNDVVCLAMAPVLIDACRERRLAPVPFLLALACAANLGSALTLIGNPQNMLIGQALRLSFTGYLLEAAVPVALGLAVTWGLVWWRTKDRIDEAAAGAAGDAHAAERERRAREREAEADAVPLDRWQAGKGLLVALGIVGCFLFAPWPREVVALGGAGLLMVSRQMRSHDLLKQIDWNLLLLFVGLFIVNHALQKTGVPARAVHDLAAAGVALSHVLPLGVTTFVLSNIVSNVPAVMLLLPVAGGPQAGPTMALVSTLAGNLFIVGSVANIIVVDAASKHRVTIDWRTHARVGVPVTLATLAVTGAWLALRFEA
jgi:Na+/H+ antiporter NhaD/arsenite permease-like protein